MSKTRIWRRKRVHSYKKKTGFVKVVGFGALLLMGAFSLERESAWISSALPAVSAGEDYRLEWFVPGRDDREGITESYGIRYIPGKGLELYHSSQTQISGH